MHEVIWTYLSPSGMWAILPLIGVSIWSHFKHAGRAILLAHSVSAMTVCFFPVHEWIVRPLEEAFVRRDLSEVDGIVVLGGAFELSVSLARGQPVFNDAAERVIEAATLAHAWPRARVVVSGGMSSTGSGTIPDAELARQVLVSLGVSPERITIETQSRNTKQNAVFTRLLVDPSQEQNWLLVTSAAHMPRSMFLFEKSGWKIVAWPVDYRTGVRSIGWRATLAARLSLIDYGIREWLSYFVDWIQAYL